jgi:hypothetical protein
LKADEVAGWQAAKTSATRTAQMQVRTVCPLAEWQIRAASLAQTTAATQHRFHWRDGFVGGALTRFVSGDRRISRLQA